MCLAECWVMDIKDTNPSAITSDQRPDEPLGDLGDEKTWEPPPGEQGISNRPDDEDTDESNPRGSRRAANDPE